MAEAAVSKSIEITAKTDTSGAVKAIQSLSRSINSIKRALGKISNTDASINSLNKLVNAMERINKLGKAKFSLSIRKGSIENIQKINDAAGSIQTDKIGKISNLYNELRKLSTISSQVKGLTGLSTVARGLEKMSKIGNIDLKISQGTVDNLKTFVNAISTLDDASVQKVKDLGEAMKYLNASKIEALKNITTNATDKGTSTENKPNTEKGGSSGEIVDTSSTKEAGRNTDELKNKMSSLSAVIAGIKKGLSIEKRYFSILFKAAAAEIKITISAFKKLASIAKTALSTAVKWAGKLVVAFGKQFVEPLEKGFNVIKSAVSGLFRIAYYRVFRSIIKSITEAFSTGMENMYYWASTADTVLKGSMDSLATSAQYLKNSIAAMFSSLINTVAPIIEALVDKIASALNQIGNFFAQLTGSSTYTQAVRVPTTYADALDDAADSANNAKKASQWLLGIDELNILPDDTDTGTSSSNSGKTYADYANMFQTVNADQWDWVQKIKDLWNSGKYAELGTYVAELLNDVVDGWDSKKWAQNLGKKIQNGLTVALNFVRTFKFDKLAEKLGGIIQGLIETISGNDIGAWFGKEFSDIFEMLDVGLNSSGNWGSWLSDIIDGWFDEVDGATIASHINGIANNIITNLRDFIGGISWEDIRADISGFWNGLDFKGIWTNFKSLLSTAEDAVFSLTGANSWGELAGKIGNWIGNAAKGVGEWWRKNKGDISSLWNEIWNGFAQGVDPSYSTFADMIAGILPDVRLAISQGFNDLVDWISNSGLLDDFAESLCYLIDDLPIDEVVSHLMSALGSGVWKYITQGNQQHATGSGTSSSSNTFTWKSTPLSVFKSIFGNNSSYEGSEENPEKVYVTPALSSGSPSLSTVVGTTSTSKNPIPVYTQTKISSSTPTLSELTGAEDTRTKPITVFTTTVESSSSPKLAELTGTKDTETSPLQAGVTLKRGTGYIPLTTFIGTDQTYSVGVTPYLTKSVSSLFANQSVTAYANTSSSGTRTSSGNVLWNVTFRAGGGFVDQGQLFVANEAGAEMVGSMDGKTAVANNDQIVAGIQQGVYNAMVRAMSSSSSGNTINLSLNLDGKTVYDSVVKQNRDTYNRTGRNPLTAY